MRFYEEVKLYGEEIKIKVYLQFLKENGETHYEAEIYGDFFDTLYLAEVIKDTMIKLGFEKYRYKVSGDSGVFSKEEQLGYINPIHTLTYIPSANNKSNKIIAAEVEFTIHNDYGGTIYVNFKGDPVITAGLILKIKDTLSSMYCCEVSILVNYDVIELKRR